MAEGKTWLVDILRERASECVKCGLHESRKTVVFGDGDPLSKLYILGEAPGEEEDEAGLPFIGKSGKLLREALETLGVLLPKIFITNTLMCRPPENRDPNSQELGACSDWLLRKIGIAEPKVIIAVGKYALGWLLGIPHDSIQRQVKITQIVREKKVFNSKKLSGIPLPELTIVPTVHPAYVLRGGCSREDFLAQLGLGAVLAERLRLDVFG